MIIKFFQEKNWKSSQKSFAAFYTPKTFYALSHPIHGSGMKKKCERKMRLCHAKVLPLQQKSDSRPHWSLHQPQKEKRKGARVAEEARLESVYTSKAYRGFESPSFRYKSTDRQAMKPDGL